MYSPVGITFCIVWEKPWLLFSKLQNGVRPMKEDGFTPYRTGGIRLDLLYGTLKRPIPKFWKKEFWSRNYIIKEQATNPWNSGNFWFVLSIPFMVGFFLSVSIGFGKRQPGFYFGLKTYVVDHISCQAKQYNPDGFDEFLFDDDENPILTWCKRDEIGTRYLCPSFSIREDLVD